MKKIFVILSLIFLLFFTFSCQKSEEGITEEEAKVLFDKAFEMWNSGNLGIVDEIIAPEYVLYSDPHDPYENQALDHATYKKRVLETRAATPDIQFTNEDIIINRDKAVNRWTVSGTNKRTGKQFSVTGITIYHVVDGKLKGHWQNVDKLGLYQQLGFTLTPPRLTESLE